MCAKRIKGYLDGNGIKYSFLADKIGIPKQTLSGKKTLYTL
jgi:hypothetical protein